MSKKATNKGIYIATTEPNIGKSIISLGLMQSLLGKAAKVAYFRPIIDDFKPGKIDNHINTISTYFKLDINFEDVPATGNPVFRLRKVCALLIVGAVSNTNSSKIRCSLVIFFM